jgi:hypothetical protein
MRAGSSPGAATHTVTTSGVALSEADQGLGPGTARRVRSMAAAPAPGAGLPAATGRVKVTSASSGMQVFSQTSHAACPRRVTGTPVGRPAGAVSRVSSTTSLV